MFAVKRQPFRMSFWVVNVHFHNIYMSVICCSVLLFCCFVGIALVGELLLPLPCLGLFIIQAASQNRTGTRPGLRFLEFPLKTGKCVWCDVSAGRCEPRAVICVLGSRRGERPVNVLPTITTSSAPSATNPSRNPSTLSTKCWVNVFTNNQHHHHQCTKCNQVPQVPSVGSMFYHHHYLSVAGATPQLTLYGLSSSLWQQCFEQQHFCGFPAKGDSAQVRCS